MIVDARFGGQNKTAKEQENYQRRKMEGTTVAATEWER